MKIKAGMEAEYAHYVTINSDHPYSAEIVRYGEAWADLMEQDLANGATLDTSAKPTAHEADTGGVTGYMHGAAANVLAHFWEHGEALRRWHNLDTQIGNEGERANETGGTLNPALLTMEL